MRALAVLPCLVLVLACGEEPDAAGDAGRDASTARDAALDAPASPDAQVDAGLDAGSDAGPPRSAGCVDGAGLAEGEHTFELEGRARRYVLRLPVGYTADRPWPLVLALHGNDGTTAYWDGTSGDRDIRSVLRDDAILIVAEAIGGDWRDYAVPADTWPARLESELLYFDEVLSQARADLCVREDAIFAMGFSGGGSFAGVLACRRDDIRAIAVGGAVIYFDEAECVGEVAAWITIGTLELNAGREQYRDFFRDRAGCALTSASTDPSPCVAYEGCDPGTPVHYCQHPGDHVWPDFGSEAMWSFFQQQLE